jgi:threonine dehydrogenase-like Zn-dependent dehydrogenase
LGHEICADYNGKIVSVNPYFTCGTCIACVSGRRNCCLKNQTMGVQRDGAFAEYIVVPENQMIQNLYDTDPKVFSLLEPFAVSLHAVGRGTFHYDDKVLIFGSGPIGIYCAFIIKHFFGIEANIIDPNEEKIKVAGYLGLKPFENIEYDCCIEASGSSKAIGDCFKFVKPSGQIILIGHSKEAIPMPHSDIIKKELSIFASRNSIEFPQARIAMKDNEKLLKKTITTTISFSEVPSYFKTLSNNERGTIKTVIEF